MKQAHFWIRVRGAYDCLACGAHARNEQLALAALWQCRIVQLKT